MRTNVVIDDKLMSRAMRTSGCRTKRSAIESGLRLLVQINSQKKLRGLRGKITWEGDLEEMRRD
jgi:Arc/MetJ family transcription regulator